MPYDISKHTVALGGLTSREEIVDLILRACLALDHNDFLLFSSAFSSTAEPSMVIGDQPIIVGRDNLRGLFDIVGRLDTHHLLSGPRIDFKPDGDTAILTCNSLNQHFRPEEGLKPSEFRENYLVGGLYEVDLIKENEEWKIFKWAMKIIWTQGTQAVMFPN